MTTFEELPVWIDLWGELKASGSTVIKDAYGVEIFYEALDWRNLPPTSGTFTQRPYTDGGVITDSRYGSRVITLRGWVMAADRPAAEAAMRRFKLALNKAKNTPRPLVMHQDQSIRHIMVQIDQEQAFLWDLKLRGKFQFDLQFIAKDHRVFWGEPDYQHSVITPSTAPAELSVVNEGGSAVPKLRIDLRGFDRPSIAHLETGRSFTISKSFGSAEMAIIDFDARSITDQSGQSLRGQIVGRLFKLLEGTNTFRITADGYAGSEWVTRYSSTEI